MAIAIEGAVPLIMVYDVPSSLAFYRDILGFQVVNSSPPFTPAKDDFGWALLRLNGVELMLNNAYENNVRPTAPDPFRNKAHGDIVFYFACRDLQTAVSQLRAQGIAAPDPKDTYYGMRQVCIRDPDGYTICLQRPVEEVTASESERPR